MIVPTLIVDDEDDDEEIVKGNVQGKTVPKPVIVRKQRNLSNRFRNLSVYDVSGDLDKENDREF